MTARFFEYKGHVGAAIDMKEGKFINDPFEPGQLGCVISTEEVQMTPKVKELIQKAERTGGSFSPLMLTKHSDGTGSSIGIMGGGKMYMGKSLEIGRTCELSVLEDCTVVDEEAPIDFRDFIDGLE
jgi:hypothetical protein